MRNERGMTLTEVVVATIVLSIVLLLAGTIYVSGVKEMQRAVAEAAVQTQASLALDDMFLKLIGCEGLTTTVFPSPNQIIAIPYAGEQIKYSLNSTTHKLEFYPHSKTKPAEAPEIIANNITSLSFDRPLTAGTPARPVKNYVTMTVTAEKDRMKKTFTTGVVVGNMEPF